MGRFIRKDKVLNYSIYKLPHDNRTSIKKWASTNIQRETDRFREIIVREPTITAMPPGKWHVWAKLKAIGSNRKELRRAEQEYVAAAKECEDNSDYWRYHKHYERAIILLEKAAEFLEKADKIEPGYMYKCLELRRDACTSYGSKDRTRESKTPELMECVARCYDELGNRTIAEELATAAGEMRRRIRDIPSYSALMEIYRLQRRIIELNAEGKSNEISKLLSQITDLVLLASREFEKPYEFQNGIWEYMKNQCRKFSEYEQGNILDRFRSHVFGYSYLG